MPLSSPQSVEQLLSTFTKQPLEQPYIRPDHVENVYSLEICCSSLESAIIADKAGADRIELCQNLEDGGITPSYGLLKAVMGKVSIPVHVLIRVRTGHFVYTEDEIAIMRDDILNLKQCNPAGFVIGAMTEEGLINSAHCLILIEAARGTRLTFHRAFDNCTSQTDMFEVLMQLGFHRLLTSAGGRSALESPKSMAWLVEKAQGRIEIMAGAGITPRNASRLLDMGVKSIHSSAKRTFHPPSWNRHSLFSKSQIQADPDTVAALVKIVEKYKQRDRPPAYSEK